MGQFTSLFNLYRDTTSSSDSSLAEPEELGKKGTYSIILYDHDASNYDG
jgi:hypothetical protein